MSKKILIITGGTGGHIYPAMALAQQIDREMPNSEVLFIGGGLSTNRYFDHSSFVSHTVHCGAFVNKSPLAIFKSLKNISIGIWQSWHLIRKFHPDVVIGFGSFYSFPSLIAAKLKSVPIILHEANSIPGKVNYLLSKYATVSTVHFPQTLQLLKGNTVEVGMPLREEFVAPLCSKEEAKQYFGLNSNVPVILIFGGSQGAQVINAHICETIDLIHSHSQFLCLKNSFQVIHLAGASTPINQLQQVYAKYNISAVVKPFETHMAKAWRAADMVISRAGAGAIAEQLEFEVPGILIPFKAAADNHQEHNANFMVKNVGGAKKILEHQLNANLLASDIVELLQSNKSAAMRQAMRDYKQKSRTRDLYSVVKEIIDLKS